MHHWYKDIILDITVLLVIICFALTLNSILEIILWVYSIMILATRLILLSSTFLKQKASKTSAPTYFYHILYFLNFSSFIYIQNYFLATIWGLIWVLSSYSHYKKSM